MHVSVCTVCVWALLRSGTEEEYTELHQLLEDILIYQRDFAAIKAEEQKSTVQKRNADKRKGEEMRKAAMEGISGTTLATDIFCTYTTLSLPHAHHGFFLLGS